MERRLKEWLKVTSIGAHEEYLLTHRWATVLKAWANEKSNEQVPSSVDYSRVFASKRGSIRLPKTSDKPQLQVLCMKGNKVLQITLMDVMYKPCVRPWKI